MSKGKKQKSDALVEKAKALIPSVDQILNEAMTDLEFAQLSEDKILKNFGELVGKLEGKANEIYDNYENVAFKGLIAYFREGKPILSDEDIESLVFKAKLLEFQAGQMRKARAGSSFQKIVQKLLNKAGIPCEAPDKKLKKSLRRIDLVSPNAEVGREKPDQAVFLAVKRTLRERWKQVVPEHMKGATLYSYIKRRVFIGEG